MKLRQVHRWIGLTVAAFWLVQAITGTLSVFRWEIDDWTVAGEQVPVDLQAVGVRVDGLADGPVTSVSSVWTSGTKAGRFDIHYDRDDAYRVMRVDGHGKMLRDRSGEQLAAQGAIWDTITTIHTVSFGQKQTCGVHAIYFHRSVQRPRLRRVSRVDLSSDFEKPRFWLETVNRLRST